MKKKLWQKTKTKALKTFCCQEKIITIRQKLLDKNLLSKKSKTKTKRKKYITMINFFQKKILKYSEI